MKFKKIRKAVFPVAGLGTRFLPATKVMPKEMLPLLDRPLIQHAVEEAAQAGIEEFIFITGRRKEMLEEHFDYQPELMQTLEARGKTDMVEKIKSSQMPEGKFFTTRQAQPLGLGHAIWCARHLVGDEPFAIMLPDDVILNPKRGCLGQMVDQYNETGGNLVSVMNVPRDQTHKYGILDIQQDHGKIIHVKGLVEKPAPELAPSTLSIIGRYILQPEIFQFLSAFEKGAGGEIQLTDAMGKLLSTQNFYGFRFDGTRYDCGSHLGFIEANIAFALNDPIIGNDVRAILKKMEI
jgi:UTP--glucose-1-phosphate uridylyltransferase